MYLDVAARAAKLYNTVSVQAPPEGALAPGGWISNTVPLTDPPSSLVEWRTPLAATTPMGPCPFEGVSNVY